MNTDVARELTELTEMEQRRAAAMTANDLDRLADLLDDRLVYTHSDAVRDTKDAYLGKIRDGRIVYRRVENVVHGVVVQDGAALVSGETHGDAEVDGVPRRIRSSALAVWLRTGDRWRLAAYQPTPLPTA